MALSASAKNPSGAETQQQGTVPTEVPAFCRPDDLRPCITVCTPSATCDCNSAEVRQALEREISARNLAVGVGGMKMGCNGDCPYGPMVGFPRKGFFYGQVTPEWAGEIVGSTLERGQIIFDLLHIDPLKSTTGSILYDRSGFIATIDDSCCMVQVAGYFLKFEEDVSCGKCVPCRVGSVELREILDRITEGDGQPEDLKRLELICHAMQEAPYCDFARTTSGPVVTILKHFRSEFDSHVDQRVCPAGVCQALAKEDEEQVAD